MSLKQLEKARWPYNLRWTVAMMDEIAADAGKGVGASVLAWKHDTTEVDIRAVCERNGIYLHKHPGNPARHNGD